jgi:hypothetical protein
MQDSTYKQNLFLGHIMLDRVQLLQNIINRIRSRHYMEIGIKNGDTFLKIRSRRKFAIDPNYRVSLKNKLKSFLDYPWNLFNQYFRMPSNDFFLHHKNAFAARGVNVIFIDGLHTYEQSLQDTINALDVLSENGVIILHDCNPKDSVSALPAGSAALADKQRQSDSVFEWCGDVWKTIVYLRAMRPDLNVRVFDCDFGLGVVYKGAPEKPLELTKEDIQDMTYKDLEANRNLLLNLKNQDEFKDLLNDLIPAG